MKGTVDDAGYRAFADGSIVDEIDQYLGVTLPTACSGNREIHFPETFHFRYKKIDTNNFQILSP